MDTDWTVIWTHRARANYFEVMEYLANNWSKREIRQFADRVEITIRALSKTPTLFAASQSKKNIRKAFVDKNNSFFYLIDNYQKRIVILAFYDNRQDPSKFCL